MSPHYASSIERTRVDEQIHQDPLSTDRTLLANERTMLAYVRTAVTLLAGGFSFINFFPSRTIQLIGWMILVPALIVMYVGAKRYVFLKRAIAGHFSLL